MLQYFILDFKTSRIFNVGNVFIFHQKKKNKQTPRCLWGREMNRTSPGPEVLHMKKETT